MLFAASVVCCPTLLANAAVTSLSYAPILEVPRLELDPALSDEVSSAIACARELSADICWSLDRETPWKATRPDGRHLIYQKELRLDGHKLCGGQRWKNILEEAEKVDAMATRCEDPFLLTCLELMTTVRRELAQTTRLQKRSLAVLLRHRIEDAPDFAIQHGPSDIYQLRWANEHLEPLAGGLRCFFGHWLSDLFTRADWLHIQKRHEGIAAGQLPEQIGFGVYGALRLYRNIRTLDDMKEPDAHQNGYSAPPAPALSVTDQAIRMIPVPQSD